MHTKRSLSVMFTSTLFTSSVLALGAIGACHGDHEHEEAGCGLEANCARVGTVDFAQGITREGNDGNLSVRLISADPAPPQGGEAEHHADVDGGTEESGYVDNHWVVEVLDGEGERVEDSDITVVRTWSMDCGHYGVDEADDSIAITHEADGTFSWTHAYLHGGPWSVQIQVSGQVSGVGETDLVEFPFCLDQTETDHHH